MTRKHFEAIAKAIRDERWRIAIASAPSHEAREAVTRLALAFADGVAVATNPKFDRNRFLEACGIGADEVAHIEATAKAHREAVLASLRTK